MKESLILNKIIFYLGYYWYQLSKKNNHLSFIAFRRLFFKTGGFFNDYINKKIEKKDSNQYDLSNSIISNLNPVRVNEIVNEIEENGLFIFPEKVDDKVCQNLIQLAKETKCNLMPNPRKLPPQKPNFEFPKAVKYQIPENDLLKNETVQRLLIDQGFIAIASSYLKSIPLLDFVTSWWSFPSEKPSNEIAQLYHCDMDRLKFIKFFIYLTDVNENNGPHCYVRKSHKVLPIPLRKDRRFTDNEIKEIFPSEDILELTAPKGTLMAIDTRGIHKGLVLKKDYRLIFQIEFANSLFGKNTPIPNPFKFSNEFRKAKSKFQIIYKRFEER